MDKESKDSRLCGSYIFDFFVHNTAASVITTKLHALSTRWNSDLDLSAMSASPLRNG